MIVILFLIKESIVILPKRNPDVMVVIRPKSNQKVLKKDLESKVNLVYIRNDVTLEFYF